MSLRSLDGENIFKVNEIGLDISIEQRSSKEV